MSRYQKGKTNLDFTEGRDSEWQWHPLGHMQVCTSLQTDNHASTPPLSFLQAGCPSCRPTNSVTALKEKSTNKQNEKHNLRLKQNMTSSRSVNDNYANCAEEQLMTYRLSVEDAAASLVVLQFTFLVGLTLVSGQQRPRRRLLHRSQSNTSALSVTDLLQINNQSA